MSHQSSRRAKQFFYFNEAVIPQRATRCNEINNRFRHPCNRAEFNGTVQMNQLNWKVECIEIFPSAVRELAGNSAVGGEIQGSLVSASGLNSNGHPTSTKTKVDQLCDWQLVLL